MDQCYIWYVALDSGGLYCKQCWMISITEHKKQKLNIAKHFSKISLKSLEQFGRDGLTRNRDKQSDILDREVPKIPAKKKKKKKKKPFLKWVKKGSLPVKSVKG